MKLDVVTLLPQVETIVRQAGDLLLTYFRSDNLDQRDKSAGNPVTEADLASERFLITNLRDLLPEAAVFAEESVRALDSDYCWVIDPLDGTVNFSRGLDYFSVSVALTHKNSPVLGVVYRPVGDELFTAAYGYGAYHNGQKIIVGDVGELDKAFVGVCLPYHNGEFEGAVRVFDALARSCYGVRKLGSAALDQAYVACGRLDAAVQQGLGWWDVAAGMLLVSEAGGYVTDYEGNKVGPDYLSYVATNQRLHKKIITLF